MMIAIMFLGGIILLGVIGVYIAKWLVVSGIFDIPRSRNSYKKFKTMIYTIQGVVSAVLVVFLLFLHMNNPQGTITGGEILILALLFLVIFSFASVLYCCPNCGKLVAPPIRGYNDALYHLTIDECSNCGFKFED